MFSVGVIFTRYRGEKKPMPHELQGFHSDWLEHGPFPVLYELQRLFFLALFGGSSSWLLVISSHVVADQYLAVDLSGTLWRFLELSCYTALFSPSLCPRCPAPSPQHREPAKLHQIPAAHTMICKLSRQLTGTIEGLFHLCLISQRSLSSAT